MGEARTDGYRFFDAATLPVFAAAAGCLVPAEPGGPGGVASPGADDPRCLRVADAMIAERPVADRRLLRVFLFAVQLLPVMRYGRRFTRLSVPQRNAVLRFLERNRAVPKLRAGFFGLKNFALLGYYGSELSFAELGYPGPRTDAPYYRLRSGGAR